MWHAPSVWAQESFLPVATSDYKRPKLTDTMKSYGKDHIKQGYWYGFGKAVEHLQKLTQGGVATQEDLSKAQAAVQSFRDLGSKCMFNIRVFKDSTDMKFETFQLLVGVEEQRDRWGLTNSRLVALIELAEQEVSTGAKKVADETIHNLIAKKISFPEDSPLCSVKTLNKIRKISTAYQACPRLREVSRCAEAKYQRKQMFDEWTKVHNFISKADTLPVVVIPALLQWVWVRQASKGDACQYHCACGAGGVVRWGLMVARHCSLS